MSRAFYYHCLRRDISNFSLLKHRKFDGFLISMHQSGTHWLKHMLATALTHKYDLPPPRYIHANDVIAGPKDPQAHPQLPHIVSAHSIPHILLSFSPVHKLMRFPPYVILVRDIRAMLVSNYEKWKEHYGCDFATFLKGDVSGHRFNNDIWWCIRFCNMWGKIADKLPESVCVIKYEDLRATPLLQLQEINRYWDLNLSEAQLQYAIDESTKEKMLKKKDPDTPFGVDVVRPDKRPYLEWFEKDQQQYIHEMCKKFLRYNFDYEY